MKFLLLTLKINTFLYLISEFLSIFHPQLFSYFNLKLCNISLLFIALYYIIVRDRVIDVKLFSMEAQIYEKNSFVGCFCLKLFLQLHKTKKLYHSDGKKYLRSQEKTKLN